jgi:hypothetical protein
MQPLAIAILSQETTCFPENHQTQCNFCCFWQWVEDKGNAFLGVAIILNIVKK